MSTIALHSTLNISDTLEIKAWFQRNTTRVGNWRTGNQIKWSRNDRWRHLTQKGQTRDPNTLLNSTQLYLTRSQAVTRNSRPYCLTAHTPLGVTWRHRLRDHLIAYAISYWWFFGTKPLSVTVSEIFNVECNAMADMTLIRPLNEGQVHSFWYQSISYIRLSVVTFALGRTV